MGKTNPILQAVVTNWDDGVTDHGMGEPRDGSTELYTLAHREKSYEGKRVEDGDEIEHTESQYRLYDPEELSVDQHNTMKANSFHFHTITERDLMRMLNTGFDGRSCPDG